MLPKVLVKITWQNERESPEGATSEALMLTTAPPSVCPVEQRGHIRRKLPPEFTPHCQVVQGQESFPDKRATIYGAPMVPLLFYKQSPFHPPSGASYFPTLLLRKFSFWVSGKTSRWVWELGREPTSSPEPGLPEGPVRSLFYWS